MQDPVEIHTGFDRPNLTFDAIEASGKARRLQLLEHGLKIAATRPAIVYVRTRKDSEMVAEALVATGLPAEAYHAGLGRDVREQRQDDLKMTAQRDGEGHSAPAELACGVFSASLCPTPARSVR